MRLLVVVLKRAGGGGGGRASTATLELKSGHSDQEVYSGGECRMNSADGRASELERERKGEFFARLDSDAGHGGSTTTTTTATTTTTTTRLCR
jgi:hypothetical protein